MIFDISDSAFKRIMAEEKLHLPIRWDGVDFSTSLFSLFHSFLQQLEQYACNDEKFPLNRVKETCGMINKAVEHYLNGFPSKAYDVFAGLMAKLMETPLVVYRKSILEQLEGKSPRNDDDLQLFRAVSVQDNKPYGRTRVFHTPYTLRSKVSTSRYSIAGYPSLYLGTSLALCCEEIHLNPYKDYALASAFQIERCIALSNASIRVIELGVKPQDFLKTDQSDVQQNDNPGRVISDGLLRDRQIRSAYLLWYPLIAASSFIRANKSDPFAAEYIVPQLLMQWIRSEMAINQPNDCAELIGIRYFSCASMKASDMGFNYVFSTSGQRMSQDMPYCPVLARSFRTTIPKYVHEYESIRACELALKKDHNFNYIISI